MSGRKSNLFRFQNITDGDMSGDVTSIITNIQQLDNIGFQVVWTGTPVGSFDIQVSLNYTQDEWGNVQNAGDWSSIGLTPAPAAEGSADSAYIDINQISAPWIRLIYTRTSGTGTLQGYVTAKMV